MPSQREMERQARRARFELITEQAIEESLKAGERKAERVEVMREAHLKEEAAKIQTEEQLTNAVLKEIRRLRSGRHTWAQCAEFIRNKYPQLSGFSGQNCCDAIKYKSIQWRTRR